jgi:hypothetical protein
MRDAITRTGAALKRKPGPEHGTDIGDAVIARFLSAVAVGEHGMENPPGPRAHVDSAEDRVPPGPVDYDRDSAASGPGLVDVGPKAARCGQGDKLAGDPGGRYPGQDVVGRRGLLSRWH